MKTKLTMVSLLFFSIGLFLPLPQWASVNISKVGELENPSVHTYYDVAVSGNYAYCLRNYSLDIVNISNPAAPVLVSSNTSYDYCDRMEIHNNRAYLLDDDDLYVLDLSSPTAPTLWGTVEVSDYGTALCITDRYAYVGTGYYNNINIMDISGTEPPSTVIVYNTGWAVYGLHQSGNYLYVAAGSAGIKILDITTPTSPALVSEVSTLNSATDIFVTGNYAYVSGQYLGLAIYDISTPQSPVKVGEYISGGYGNYYEMTVHGGFVFFDISNSYYGGNRLEIIDVSNPSKPVLKTTYRYAGIDIGGIAIQAGVAYLADANRGLRIVDISNPAAPARLGALETYGGAWSMIIDGNYLYMGRSFGLQVIKISSPSTPKHISFTETDSKIYAMDKRGSYIYLAIDNDEPKLQVFNVSNPAAPSRAGEVTIAGSDYLRTLEVNSNYAYGNSGSNFFVFDVSDPSNPARITSLGSSDSRSLALRGDYIYLLTKDKLKVIDVSTPSSPSVMKTVSLETSEVSFNGSDIAIKGKYAFILGSGTFDFWVYDLSDPDSPSLAYRMGGYDGMDYLRIDGDEAYLVESYKEIAVLDISKPLSPQLMGYYDGSDSISRPAVSNSYIYLNETYDDLLEVYRYQVVGTPPKVSVNRDTLYFCGLTTGEGSPPQAVWINNAGGGTLNWRIYNSPSWLDYSPYSSYYGSSKLTLSLDDYYLGYLDPGTYTGTVIVENSDIDPDSQSITVNLQLFDPSETLPPFGDFATPTDRSTVSSSVPFTGWALDDVGVDSVKLYLVSGGDSTYIGDALLVEGARPDIESAYHTYPQAYKAGWGYMMLTNFLPNGGNGTYTIRAVAVDMEGNETILGSKTVYVDNANAVKPFGAIDTPAQGGAASGSSFANGGWVLTPQPNSIPGDGSTIHLWIDGVQRGNPAVYGVGRNDIASLFPGYTNSYAAGAHFHFDASAFTNGVHTISWTAADNVGNTDGIGSRYFIIEGGQNRSAAGGTVSGVKRTAGHGPVTMDRVMPIEVKTGFPGAEARNSIYPDENGEILVHIKELDRVEIDLGGLGEVELVSPLPIGVSFDVERGIFYWMPGLAYVGDYDFIFHVHDGSGIIKQKPIRIRVLPKY